MVATRSTGLRPWLAIPLVLALFALIGLAASTEDGESFRDRIGDGDFRPDPSGRPERYEIDDTELVSPGGQPSGNGSGNQGGSGGWAEWSDRNGGTGTDLAEWDGYVVDAEITGPDGELKLDFRGEGTVAAPSDGDDVGKPELLGPQVNADGDLRDGRPLRFDGSGLEQLGSDADSGDEGDGLLLVPSADGGIDLPRPDGSTIEIRPGFGDIGATATEVAEDGTRTPLVPDADGTVPIDEDTSITLTDPPRTVWQRAVATPWKWILVAYVVDVILSLALALYLYLTRPREAFGADFVGPSGVPADQFEEFLAMLLADEDHARAIRLAFEAAERGAGGLTPRYSSETPSEWAERAGQVRPDLAEPVTELCSLFATARFAPDRPSSEDRDRAVAALRAIRWPADAAPSGSGDGALSDLVGTGP